MTWNRALSRTDRHAITAITGAARETSVGTYYTIVHETHALLTVATVTDIASDFTRIFNLVTPAIDAMATVIKESDDG